MVRGDSHHSWQAWDDGESEGDWTWEQPERYKWGWWGKWDDDCESTGTSETASSAEPKAKRGCRGRGRDKKDKKSANDAPAGKSAKGPVDDSAEVRLVENATTRALVPLAGPHDGSGVADDPRGGCGAEGCGGGTSGWAP